MYLFSIIIFKLGSSLYEITIKVSCLFAKITHLYAEVSRYIAKVMRYITRNSCSFEMHELNTSRLFVVFSISIIIQR